MENFYTKKTSKGGKLKELGPQKETIKFLLNYSKALRVVEHRSMKFEMLLN